MTKAILFSMRSTIDWSLKMAASARLWRFPRVAWTCLCKVGHSSSVKWLTRGSRAGSSLGICLADPRRGSVFRRTTSCLQLPSAPYALLCWNMKGRTPKTPMTDCFAAALKIPTYSYPRTQTPSSTCGVDLSCFIQTHTTPLFHRRRVDEWAGCCRGWHVLLSVFSLVANDR